jgi:hypothetical protein
MKLLKYLAQACQGWHLWPYTHHKLWPYTHHKHRATRAAILYHHHSQKIFPLILKNRGNGTFLLQVKGMVMIHPPCQPMQQKKHTSIKQTK